MSKFVYLIGETIMDARFWGPSDTNLRWVRSIITDRGELEVTGMGSANRRNYLICHEVSALGVADSIILHGTLNGSELKIRCQAIESPPSSRLAKSYYLTMGPTL